MKTTPSQPPCLVESLSEAVSKSKGTKIDHIKRQSHLWTTQSAEDYDDSEAPISDFRVNCEPSLH
jgi:hypothetical protein